MSFQYVEAPDQYVPDGAARLPRLFVAGGITGCPDWQQEYRHHFEYLGTPLIFFNPRRADFPMGDPDAAQAQIEWEYEQLHKADAISFWFSRGSLNPIVLFELGSWLHREKPIFIGIDPEYERQSDVEIQVSLARPTFDFAYDLGHLVKQVDAWATWAASIDPAFWNIDAGQGHPMPGWRLRP